MRMVIYMALVALASALSTQSAMPAAATKSKITPNAKVITFGLETATELNGKVGTAKKFMAKRDRWAVEFDEPIGGITGPRAVKEENIVLLSEFTAKEWADYEEKEGPCQYGEQSDGSVMLSHEF